MAGCSKLQEATGMQDNITSSSGTQGSSNDSTSTSSGKEKSIADEMFAEYKKMMREKQKAAMVGLSFRSLFFDFFSQPYYVHPLYTRKK